MNPLPMVHYPAGQIMSQPGDFSSDVISTDTV